jgi:hypothetical protein
MSAALRASLTGSDEARAKSQLHAESQIGVLDDCAGTTLRIGVGEMRQLAAARRSRDADRRQIDERADAGTHFAIEQVVQPGKVCGARTPGVA